MNRKEKKMKKKAVDPVLEQQQFNNQTFNFKSRVSKGEGACYSIMKKTECLNEGNYNINFDLVDPKKKMADIQLREKTASKPRMFSVPPCVIKSAECSIETRQKVKREMP